MDFGVDALADFDPNWGHGRVLVEVEPSALVGGQHCLCLMTRHW